MPLLERDKAIEALGDHLPDIYDAIALGWRDWVLMPPEQKVDLTPRARASYVHDKIVSHATRLLPEAVVVDKSDLPLFVFQSVIAIKFKKLDTSLLSCNQQTDQVRQFRAQQPLAGVDAVHHLEAGYVLDALGQEIHSIHLVCPNGPGIYWAMELSEVEAKSDVVDMFERSAPVEEPIVYRRKNKGIVVPFKREDEGA